MIFTNQYLYHTSMFLTNQIAQNEVIYFTYYTSQFTYYTSNFTYHTAEWTRCEQNSYQYCRSLEKDLIHALTLRS